MAPGLFINRCFFLKYKTIKVTLLEDVVTKIYSDETPIALNEYEKLCSKLKLLFKLCDIFTQFI